MFLNSKARAAQKGLIHALIGIQPLIANDLRYMRLSSSQYIAIYDHYMADKKRRKTHWGTMFDRSRFRRDQMSIWAQTYLDHTDLIERVILQYETRGSKKLLVSELFSLLGVYGLYPIAVTHETTNKVMADGVLALSLLDQWKFKTGHAPLDISNLEDVSAWQLIQEDSCYFEKIVSTLNSGPSDIDKWDANVFRELIYNPTPALAEGLL